MFFGLNILPQFLFVLGQLKMINLLFVVWRSSNFVKKWRDRAMNRHLVRLFILLAIFCQIALFYSYLANQYQHIKYSTFYADEDVEVEEAKEREKQSISYISALKDPRLQDDGDLKAKRAQLSESLKEFWKRFNNAYSNDTSAGKEVRSLLTHCVVQMITVAKVNQSSLWPFSLYHYD